jgi:hypothetical protein
MTTPAIYPDIDNFVKKLQKYLTDCRQFQLDLLDNDLYMSQYRKFIFLFRPAFYMPGSAIFGPDDGAMKQKRVAQY